MVVVYKYASHIYEWSYTLVYSPTQQQGSSSPVQQGCKAITAGRGASSTKAAAAAIPHSFLLSLDVSQAGHAFLKACVSPRARWRRP